MSNSVSDWFIWLAAAGLMFGAFIHAGFVHLVSEYRRRRGVVAPGAPAVYRPRAEVEAAVVRQHLVARAAERIVAAELDRVAPLYEEPTRSANSN
jgi:hypothetical protein